MQGIVYIRRTARSLRRAWFVTSFSHFRTDLSCEEARIARLVPHGHRQSAEDQLQQPDDVIARNYNDITRWFQIRRGKHKAINAL